MFQNLIHALKFFHNCNPYLIEYDNFLWKQNLMCVSYVTVKLNEFKTPKNILLCPHDLY